MAVAVWIIAVCALIWTIRMLLIELMEWLVLHYKYRVTPEWLIKIAQKL